MVKLNDKALMAAAIAVTAVLCIAGTYVLTGSGNEKQNVSVIVHDLGEEMMGPVFSEFEMYTNSRINASFVTVPPSFGDGIDVIMSGDHITAGAGIETIETEISGTTVYVYFASDPQGMTGFFINWLENIY